MSTVRVFCWMAYDLCPQHFLSVGQLLSDCTSPQQCSVNVESTSPNMRSTHTYRTPTHEWLAGLDELTWWMVTHRGGILRGGLFLHTITQGCDVLVFFCGTSDSDCRMWTLAGSIISRTLMQMPTLSFGFFLLFPSEFSHTRHFVTLSCPKMCYDIRTVRTLWLQKINDSNDK